MSSPLAFLTRRRFLALAGGTATVVGGGAGGLAFLRGTAPSVDGLRVLSAQGYRTLAAVARTHLPAGGAIVDGADDADLARAFDGYLADEPDEVVRDLSLALHLIEFGPLLFDHRAATFSNLDADGQLTHWEKWLYADEDLRRQIAVALKKFLALVFFDRPEVWPAIGYPGPSFHGLPSDDRPAPPPRPRHPNVFDCGTASPPASIRVAIAVIGSGCAGATTAWVMADGGRDVLVLEEGTDKTGAELTQRDGAMYDQLYMDRGGRMTTDMSVAVLQGRVLGGGGVINASDVVPLEDEVLDLWVTRFGLTDWTPDALRAARARALLDLSASPIPEAMVTRNNQLLRAGAEAIGASGHVMMHNRVGCGGMGTCLIGCPLDAKRNPRMVAIPAALDAGARVWTRARVVRIEDADQPVKRLIVRTLDPKGYRETGEVEVLADTVVLAANAIGSAALLKRSGIGNAHVGRHLSLQPQLPILADFPEPVIAFRGIPQSYAIDAGEAFDDRRGLWGYRVESIMGTPGIVASLLPFAGQHAKNEMTRYPHIAASLLLTPDEPVGSVSVSKGGRVRVDYALPGDVVERYRQAVKTAARAYLAAGATRVMVPSLPPVIIASEADLPNIDAFDFPPASAPLLSAHQQGGVRAAPTAADGAAAPDGQVYGTRGVYCFDSGLYPTSSSSHTMAPILATSRWLAEALHAQLG